MWNTAIESLDGGRVQRMRIRNGDRVLPYAAVVEGWRADAGFRACFNQLLADAPLLPVSGKHPRLPAPVSIKRLNA